MTTDPAPRPLLDGYPPPSRPGSPDEAVVDGIVRPAYRPLAAALDALGATGLQERVAALQAGHAARGVTFRLGGVDRPFPLDPFPRVVGAAEWAAIEAGLVQRVRALEAFLGDVYGAQQVLRDGVVPEEVVTGSPQFARELVGTAPPTGTRVHVAGIDLVRDATGTVRVLEDNLRTPSGVSYVLANRAASERELPGLLAAADAPGAGGGVRPVDGYPARLLDVLRAASPAGRSDPLVVVLTPGPDSAAAAEHALLARATGVPLVMPGELVVDGDGDVLRVRATGARVDVVYRRVDDEVLDPAAIGTDPGPGVAGLLRAVRAGTVALANAVGNGVADDKGVYTYVPAMIRYYLGEDPLLAQVETLRCWVPDERADALARIDELVFKPVEGYGGHGIVFGPAASPAELAALRARVQADPRGWVAQPVLALSTLPTLVGGRLVPRHVDLRPFVLSDGASSWVLPGGLTRVALPEGSLVVNSSQGGGSKDTWVLAGNPPP